MTNKTMMHRLWWLDYWQLPEHEAWLTDMSRQGWHLEKTSIGAAKFLRGEPEEYRYRCDVFKADTWNSLERLELYQDAGWEHVADRGRVQIFRAPLASTVPEIYTDPEEHIKGIKKLFGEHLLGAGAALLLLSLYFFHGSKQMAQALLSANWLLSLRLFFFSWLFFHELSVVPKLFRLIRQIRLRQEAVTSTSWQREMRRKQWRGVLLILFVILTIAGFVARSKSKAFPPIPAGELPTLRLVEILGEEQYNLTNPYRSIFQNKGDVTNFYRTESSLPVPEQHYLAEAVEFPGKTDAVILHFDHYRALTPKLAKVLAENLAKAPPFSPYRARIPLPPAPAAPGFDGLWLASSEKQQDLVAWQGTHVYYLSLRGYEDTEQLLKALGKRFLP